MIEERDHAFFMSWAHRLIYEFAWPPYACELCVGQDHWQGCECDYKGAIAPGIGPERHHLIARRLWAVIARRCGMPDPGRRL